MSASGREMIVYGPTAAADEKPVVFFRTDYHSRQLGSWCWKGFGQRGCQSLFSHPKRDSGLAMRKVKATITPGDQHKRPARVLSRESGRSIA